MDEICPEKRDLLNGIQLSAATITRRVETLSDDIVISLKDVINGLAVFSIALDESTDSSDTSQLAIMIRGVNRDFDVVEEFLTMSSLHGTTTGKDVYGSVITELAKFGLPLEKLSGVCTDGAPAMVGRQNGFIGLLLKSRVWTTTPLVYHCIVHQENLGAQTLQMNHVMNLVVSTVNFIRSRALNHRQFKNLLTELDAEYNDVTYYCKVRWLSSAEILKRFWSLLTEIDVFMREKNRQHDEFKDHQWINDLAFLVDITEHLSLLNKHLQGKDQHVSTLWQQVTGFKAKLQLWINQIGNGVYTHFKSLSAREDNELDNEKYSGILKQLHDEFNRRFAQFRETEKLIKIFENPLNVTPSEAPEDFQLELIDIQNDVRVKTHYANHDLLDFYKNFLPRVTYPQLYNHGLRMASLFGSTYLCEQFFSKMKYTKSKYRTRLTDKHLTQELRLSSSSIRPNIARILASKQCQISH